VLQHLFANVHCCSVFRAGGSISSLNGISFLQTPPLSILIDQKLVETASRTSDGEKMKQAYTEQELFGICCSVGDDGLTLYGVDVNVQLDTPSSGKSFCCTTRSQFVLPLEMMTYGLTVLGYYYNVVINSVPNRTSCSLATLKFPNAPEEPTLIENEDMDDNVEPSAKRARLDPASISPPKDLMVEVEKFASILSATLDL
jgi:hypothetical protein